MKSLIKTLSLFTMLIFASAALSYDTHLSYQDRDVPGVSMAVCGFSEDLYSGSSEIVFLEKSNDSVPEPRPEMSCSEYVSDMAQFGATVKTQALPCEAILPGTDRYKMCIFVFVSTHYPL
jgi:hypothetical protein